MSIFKDHCYLAETKEDYVRMIAEGLQNNNSDLKAERRNFASAHTWENSVLEIDKAISNWFDASQHSISYK